MTTPTKEKAATLRENVALLTARQHAEAHDALLGARIADRITAFTGSMKFVVLHVLVFGLWIIANLGAIPLVPQFDPSFVLLAMAASVEAIFLSTFVLISQNRMAAAADRRAELDLHVNLLAEQELTKLAELVARIATRLDIPVDPQFHEIRKPVGTSQVLDMLDEGKREAGLGGGTPE
jgi:uncharacterized membrane protein